MTELESQAIAPKSFFTRLFSRKSLSDKLKIAQASIDTIKEKNSTEYKAFKRYYKLLQDAIQAGKDRTKAENAYKSLSTGEDSLEDQESEPGFKLKRKMEEAIQNERYALEEVKKQEYAL